MSKSLMMIFLTMAVLALVSTAFCAHVSPSGPAHPSIGVKPSRPRNFKPSGQSFSPVDLMRTETSRLEAFASATGTKLRGSFSNGPYQPDWASITKHPCPEWFLDAKMELFI